MNTSHVHFGETPGICTHTHLHIQMNFRYFESVTSDDHIILKMFWRSCGLPSATLTYIFLTCKGGHFSSLEHMFYLICMHPHYQYVLRNTLGNCFYILKEPQHLKLNLGNKMGDHCLLFPFNSFISSLTHLQMTFWCYSVLVTMSVWERWIDNEIKM